MCDFKQIILFRIYGIILIGFIKYALQYGYSIQPCYCFGEELTYWQVNSSGAIKQVLLWLNKFNIPTTFFTGTFLFFPNANIDLVVVVGKALELPLIAEPTKDDINKYHALFVERVNALFNKYKCNYNMNYYTQLTPKDISLELC